MKTRTLFASPLLLVLFAFSFQSQVFSSPPGWGERVDGAIAGELCPPLPGPVGRVVPVSSVAGLADAVNGALPGDTISIADGAYNLDGVYLRIDVPGVTLRSASGNREAVTLDGNYVTTEIIQIAASNVTVADLTLREAYYHPIHVMSTSDGDVENTLIYNVHIVDPGQQAIKINPASEGYYPDDGVVACSHIELTAAGRARVWEINGSCYTGGVDAHQAQGWVVRDNLIEGFWCPSDLSEHAVHFWVTCRDTRVERNVLRNNARGVGFGLSASGSGRTYPDDPCPGAVGYVDHYDGIVRNNFVFANDGALFSSEYGFDCGICLWQACGARVLHNTVASTQAPFSSIEWRFDNTDVDLVNNLVTHNLRDRGGDAYLEGNLTGAPLSLFADGAGGDLHLASTASAAIDQVAAPIDAPDDVDGDLRPIGSASDVGADEYGIPAPVAVTDLRVTQAVAGTGELTATLRWTAPPDAITTTLRYSGDLITAANWDSALPLADGLPGSAEVYTAAVPYGGGTIYFALKTEGAGGLSHVSNNAFWPRRDVRLPLVLKD
ncbi:MAG: hypothetical protein JW918_20480 [Anaerolineae bacterium]|nr:hypothetical protein [Anaerolineae bacterium]